MTTSGGGSANALAYVIVVVALFRGVAAVTDAGALVRRPHRSALVLWAMVAVPSIAQIVLPAIYDVLSRQPDLVRDGHQWWRLVTSAYVQDGGLFGTVTNLVVLYIVAALALPLWGGVSAGLLFVFATIAFDLPAVYVFPSAGGGNSGATFFLATSVLALLVVCRRTPVVMVASAVAVVAASFLIAIGDAHGLAFLGGFVVGLVVALLARPDVQSIPKPTPPDRR
ncbi:rhomboid family intramembrane serine protease [Actinomycetes bacterium M1A6_2h]